MNPETLAASMSQIDLHPGDLSARQQHPAPSPQARRRAPPQYHHGMSADETAQYIAQYREWFEEDRKVFPEPASHIDRGDLVAEQVRRRSELSKMAPLKDGRPGVQFFLSLVGFAKHSSMSSIHGLKPLTFKEMLVRRVHNGHYLLCRTIALCSRMVAIQTVVEDTDGVAHDLSIYSYPSTFDCTHKHLDAVFPVGSILAIREPTFKAPMQGNRPLVRVDSPTDITFVVPTSPLLRNVTWKSGEALAGAPLLPNTLEAWQERGNDHFKAAQWFLAAFAYSHGLAINPEATAIRLNRAEAYLRLRYYSGAAHDTHQVLSMENVPDAIVGKAIFRLAKAQYGRGEYDAADSNFVRWQQAHPHDSAADIWIDRSRARQEEKRGRYDWPSLSRIAKQKIRLDVADYVGPIKVIQIAGRGGGRGVLATKDIQLGEMLLVTKPFVSAYATDLPEDRIIMTLDLISNAAKERTDSVLLPRIIEKLYGNPDLRDQVYHLYAGPEYPTPPNTYPPSPAEAIAVEPLEPNVNIDIAQLEAICTYNNFCPFRLEDHRPDKQAPPTGLYPLASLFNHSCAPNALWYCIGDVMIIRAAERIPTGTEITIAYTVEESYLDRQAALKKHMLAHCTCWLCEEDRADGDARLQRRHELKTRLAAGGILSSTPSLAEARAFERDVRETFAEMRGPVRPLNALALHVVANALRASGDSMLWREALQVDMDALRCFGFEVFGHRDLPGHGARRLPIGTDRVPSVTSFLEPAAMMLRIAVTYLNLREQGNAAQWIRAALWLTNASVGGGKDLFMQVHQEMLEQMHIRDFVAEIL